MRRLKDEEVEVVAGGCITIVAYPNETEELMRRINPDTEGDPLPESPIQPLEVSATDPVY